MRKYTSAVEEDVGKVSSYSKQSGGRSVSRQSKKSRASSSKRSGMRAAQEQSFDESPTSKAEIGAEEIDFEQDEMEESPAEDIEEEEDPNLTDHLPPDMSRDEKDPRRFSGLPSVYTRRIIPAGKYTYKSEGVGALMGGV